jgi:hypothetical protein
LNGVDYEYQERLDEEIIKGGLLATGLALQSSPNFIVDTTDLNFGDVPFHKMTGIVVSFYTLVSRLLEYAKLIWNERVLCGGLRDGTVSQANTSYN